MAREGLRPLEHAIVTVAGAANSSTTEEHGLFFLGGLPPAPVLVLVKTPGYIASFQAVTPAVDSLREVLFVLDSVTADPDGQAQAAMAEFEERTAKPGTQNLLFPRGPSFDGHSDTPIRWALERIFQSPALMKKQVVAIQVMTACIVAFHAPPTVTPVSLDEIDAADIEAVEAYGPRTSTGHRIQMRLSQDDAAHCIRDGGGYTTVGTPIPRLNPDNYYAYSPQQLISRGTLLVVWLKTPDRWRR